MKQVIQSVRGELSVMEIPLPVLRPEGVLMRTGASLVSAGTERNVVEFASGNLLQKARSRPDLVRQVKDKMQREGVLPTLESVQGRMAQPLALGYSSAGVVDAVGSEAQGFSPGDRVACAGGGYATHAEVAYIPRNLAVHIPDNVSYEAAAFTTVGAIALQGVRQAEVELGDAVAVIGLGLVGQLAVRMLRAAGCRVFGVDLNEARVKLAVELGAHDGSLSDSAQDEGSTFTRGHGFDAVLIAADTRGDEPVSLAGEITRERGTVVAVGAVGMHIPRKPYYEKELTFRLSRSYGPGRYDAEYEEKGHDYPYGYVRWTEQRNMEAVVEMLSAGTLQTGPLTTHRFPIEEAEKAYDLVTGKTGEPSLGVLFTYEMAPPTNRRIMLGPADPTAIESHSAQSAVAIGLIGAGGFATVTLLPAMKDIPGLERVGIVSASGVSARAAADRFGFAYCATGAEELLSDNVINWILILTRHDQHAGQCMEALKAGKDVFVEKPLAMNREQLAAVLREHARSGRRLMVGFNRRFAPMAQRMRGFLAGHTRPLMATYRINAGAIPREHWTQDPNVGGGRLIGEGCHFIDLLQFLIGSPPVEVVTRALAINGQAIEDEVMIQLSFADGSVGSVIYGAGGDKAFGKERIEIIGDRKVAILDDFRRLDLVTNGKHTRRREHLRPDKGHRGEWQALVAAAIRGEPAPIPIEAIVNTHLATFAAVESLHSGLPIRIDLVDFWEQTRAA